MRAGVEVVIVAGQCFQTLQVLGHCLQGKLARPLFGRTGIVGIGGMSHEWAKIILRHKVTQGRHIIHVKVFRLAAARVARKECNGIGANG